MRLNYIGFEGIDGSGKSTTCTALCNLLASMPGAQPIVIHDPDSAFPGEAVRNAWRQGTQLKDNVWALLFAASSISSQVRPSGILSLMDSGFTVLSDRCALSTYAYLNEKCSFEWLDDIHTHYLFPEILFFFDIAPSLSMDRLRKANRQKSYTIEYFENIRSRYHASISHLRTMNVNIVVMDITEHTTVDFLTKAIAEYLL